ncbi:hypothetical protein B7P43_G08795, partial [Cryptotermes secundus]
RNIGNFIKAQRISWLGHISRMEAVRTDNRIYDWQPHSIRKRGRPKIRWKDDVLFEDLKDLGIHTWITRTQDRSSWKEIVERPKRSRNEAIEPYEEEESVTLPYPSFTTSIKIFFFLIQCSKLTDKSEI